jgi:hypothetical protein
MSAIEEDKAETFAGLIRSHNSIIFSKDVVIEQKGKMIKQRLFEFCSSINEEWWMSLEQHKPYPVDNIYAGAWVEKKDSRGLSFWWNSVTKQSSWLHPDSLSSPSPKITASSRSIVSNRYQEVNQIPASISLHDNGDKISASVKDTALPYPPPSTPPAAAEPPHHEEKITTLLQHSIKFPLDMNALHDDRIEISELISQNRSDIAETVTHCIICECKHNSNTKSAVSSSIPLATYMCSPCNCLILCSKCAMRLATGGKCKRCGRLFNEVKRHR